MRLFAFLCSLYQCAFVRFFARGNFQAALDIAIEQKKAGIVNMIRKVVEAQKAYDSYMAALYTSLRAVEMMLNDNCEIQKCNDNYMSQDSKWSEIVKKSQEEINFNYAMYSDQKVMITQLEKECNECIICVSILRRELNVLKALDRRQNGGK